MISLTWSVHEPSEIDERISLPAGFRAVRPDTIASRRRKTVRMSEPLMDGAASIGAKVVGSIAREATLDWRIASDVVAAARARSVRVSGRQLRAALLQADVFEVVRAGAPASPAVKEKLDQVECEGWTEGPPSSLLLPMLHRAAVRQVSVAESQGLLHDQIASLREATEVRRDDTRDPSLGFSQPMRDDLGPLRDSVGDPVVRRMCAALTPPEQRPQILEDWLARRPDWLPNSELIDGWLGLLAQSADLGSLAAQWIERALTGGASPRAYWMVQVANIGRSEEQALAYLEEVRGNPLVEAVLTQNSPEERERRLLEWNPTTQMQHALWHLLRAQQLLEAERLDEAVDVGVEGFETHGFVAAGLVAVRAMIARSSVPGTQALIANLVSARDLAIKIRDARRAAGMVSAEAIVMGIHASLLLMDTDRARALFTPGPDGEATLVESMHPEVREAGVTVLSQIGELSKAGELLTEASNQAVMLQVRAREAELEGDDDLSAQLWSDAVSAIDDWNEKTSVCFLLALRAVVHPFVEELRVHYPTVAREIDLVAELFQRRPGAEARAAAEALDNPRVARALSKFYSDHDRPNDALRLAEQSARRWEDPDEWLHAAIIYLRRGMDDKAIDRARKAMKAGGSAWGDLNRAAQVEVEATHRSKRWDDAVTASRTLVALEPESAEAAWSLVIALNHAAEEDQAFLEWRAHEVCRVPETVRHACLWLVLYQRHGTDMAPISEVLAVSRRFSGDEQVRRLAIGALLLAPIEERDTQVGVVELVDQFHADFPDGPTLLRTVTGDSEDGAALLAALDRAAGGPVQPSDLDEHAARGTLPVGLISMFAHRGYTQFLVERREAPRFAGTSDWGAQDCAAVETAVQKGAALDTTAALTLAMLPDELSEELVRAPAQLLASYTQLRDAHDAARELDKDGGVFFPSTEARGPIFHEPSEEERSTRRSLVRQIITQLRLTDRSEPPALALPTHDLEDIFGPWSEAIALASENQVPLWCDDAATRELATMFGVSSFGTPQLVEYLRARESVSDEQATAVDATLILQHSVGMRYRKTTWDLAASLSSTAPGGLGHAIEFGGPLHAAEKIGYATGAMERAVDDPEALRAWAAIAARYLLSVGVDERTDIDNLSSLTHGLLLAPWRQAHHLPFLFEGIRVSCGDRWYPALQKALVTLWTTIRRSISVDLAASYFVGQLRALPAEERRLALEIILRDAT